MEEGTDQKGTESTGQMEDERYQTKLHLIKVIKHFIHLHNYIHD